MDFKIGDEIEEEAEQAERQKKNSKLPIIIVIVVAILCGLLVYFVSNALFGKKEVKEEPVVATPLSLTDENVEILYAYVTYGTRGVRNDKFIKENNVTLNSFTNSERFYYALQFAQVEDFESTGKVDEDGKKIYNISSSKIRSYMQRFFGGKVTYSTDSVITYPFSFRINGQNVGIMTYSAASDGFDTVFDGLEADKEEKNLVEPYYTELVKAYKEPDGTYRLEENIIYTETKKETDSYTVYIYKDYAHTMLIETKPNQTEEMLKENPIDIHSYAEKASTITYKFALFNNMLYFESSSISNE